MFCPNCASDKFSVISVYRNKVRRDGKWIYSENDTRLILCKECGSRYFTETKITAAIEYNKSTHKKYEKPIDSDQKYLFEDEE